MPPKKEFKYFKYVHAAENRVPLCRRSRSSNISSTCMPPEKENCNDAREYNRL